VNTEKHMTTGNLQSISSKPVADDITEIELREPREAKVILHNDDYTTKEFVVQVLVEVFRKTLSQAEQLMLHIHEKGQGECGIYPFEVAETKVAVVHAKARALGFPLRCSLEFI